MKPYEAIVVGMGPSFNEWMKGDKADRSFTDPYHPDPNIKLYGTGRSGLYLPLTMYFYCCKPKRELVPDNGIPITARDDVLEPGMLPWNPAIPRGGSAGGMALGYACSHHESVALIGFDGFGSPVEVPAYFISDFRGLLQYWKTQGKKLYSLMPESVFDDLLLK